MITTILTPDQLDGIEAGSAQGVIFDVLRATTTIVTALGAGATEIHLFDSLDGARAARSAWRSETGPVRLAGESKCLRPEDFDLGNSPREMVTEKVGGATLLLSTTNGTRAAVRAKQAGIRTLFAASLLNAGATAKALIPRLDSGDTLLICSGTAGKISLEDVLGAGTVLFSLLQATYRTDLAFTDTAWLAYHAFSAVRERLSAALRLGQGGLNVLGAGLEEDIDAAARLNSLEIVAPIESVGEGLVVRRK